MKQKGFVPILIFVVVLSIGLLGLVAYLIYIGTGEIGLPKLVPVASETPVVSSTELANWKSYKNDMLSFKYPSEYSLSSDKERVLLNRKINWVVSDTSLGACRGGCPIIDTSEELQINALKWTKFKGWIGEVGGNYAQSYITFETKNPKNNGFFMITLWELPQDLSKEETLQVAKRNKVEKIDVLEEKTFDQIISTIAFTSPQSSDVSFTYLPSNWTSNGNVAKSNKECYLISGINIGKVSPIREYLAQKHNQSTVDIEKIVTNTEQVIFEGVEAVTFPPSDLGEPKMVYVRPGDESWYEIGIRWVGEGEGTTPAEGECKQEERDLNKIVKSIAFH